MAKRYTILLKKQKELESQLNHVLSLPPDTPYHQRFSQEIQQQFFFFKNLLSAEIASHPRKPSHLKHIAQWLSEQETAFHEWDSFQSSPPDDHVEKGSNCSCTESCLNDDGEAAEDLSELISLSDLEQAAKASTELSLVAGFDFEGFKEKENVEHVTESEHVEYHKSNEMSEEEKRKEEESVRVEAMKRSMIGKEEKNVVWFGKCLTPLASGVLIGMALMGVFMVRFSNCFYCFESTDYTFPFSPT